jgi:hypothetical protein
MDAPKAAKALNEVRFAVVLAFLLACYAVVYAATFSKVRRECAACAQNAACETSALEYKGLVKLSALKFNGAPLKGDEDEEEVQVQLFTGAKGCAKGSAKGCAVKSKGFFLAPVGGGSTHLARFKRPTFGFSLS